MVLSLVHFIGTMWFFWFNWPNWPMDHSHLIYRSKSTNLTNRPHWPNWHQLPCMSIDPKDLIDKILLKDQGPTHETIPSFTCDWYSYTCWLVCLPGRRPMSRDTLVAILISEMVSIVTLLVLATVWICRNNSRFSHILFMLNCPKLQCNGYYLLAESFDRVMQLNWLYFCGICQLIPLNLWPNTVQGCNHQSTCLPQLQPLCSAALVPNILPRRDEGSGKPCAVIEAL